MKERRWFWLRETRRIYRYVSFRVWRSSLERVDLVLVRREQSSYEWESTRLVHLETFDPYQTGDVFCRSLANSRSICRRRRPSGNAMQHMDDCTFSLFHSSSLRGFVWFHFYSCRFDSGARARASFCTYVPNMNLDLGPTAEFRWFWTDSSFDLEEKRNASYMIEQVYLQQIEQEKKRSEALAASFPHQWVVTRWKPINLSGSW